MLEKDPRGRPDGQPYAPINAPPSGGQRHRIPAMRLLALALGPGDHIEVIDPQGRQRAQAMLFDARGSAVNAALRPLSESNSGAFAAVDGAEMATCLQRSAAVNTDFARQQLGQYLQARHIDLSRCTALELLGDGGVAGASATAVCEAAALCLLAAPGEDMRIDAGHAVRPTAPPTELVAVVHRATASQPTPSPFAALPDALPAPLAEPREEIHIARRTAVAYRVAAGECIQVLDIDGRQCSDFQCFDLAKLDLGVERCLDITTTRSLMGAAYPQPGLHSKFYDVDFEPLIEVLQDTCGRHDSFTLACHEKYYADVGYPGHINCSDNFNAALADYPIAPRRGWMAMNLFFNTFFDPALQLACDSTWSRPGDYVLLRARKDMVCVSSACPDDIDPANGWSPSDIQVRIYPAGHRFTAARATRKTPDSAPDMTKQTGFHPRTAELTRNFTEYNGYWLAEHYTNAGAVAEYWACREGVAAVDLSPLRKAEITGPEAELLLQTCVTRNMRRLSIGQVVYTAMCHASGGMIDDGTVFRLGADNFRWVGGSDASILWLREQAKERGFNVWVKDSTEQLHNLQVQGPRSLDTMRKIICTPPHETTVDELGWFRFCIARIGGHLGAPVVVSRTGYTGERGYEIFCHPKHAPQVWDAMWQAGQEFAIQPLGLEALDMLRIEAGLVFAGYEFCDQTDPFEAGIGFTVPLKTKPDDFIGRDALIRRQASPQRKLVGLEVASQQPAAHGDGVYVGRVQVGVITSAVRSPILRANIALCRLNVEHSAIDTPLEIGQLDGHQKRIPCRVVAFPHYDPKKERVRGVA